MKRAAIGFRAHSGWAAAVAISIADGSPRVLDRSRIQLVKTFSYKFRQPYHTGAEMTLGQAASFILRVRQDAERLALAGLRSLGTKLRKSGFGLRDCCVLLAAGRPLPELEGILASHALIHTADGELFRNALLRGCERCRLRVVKIKEREAPDRALEILHLDAALLPGTLSELGRGLGPPWSQDEKLAALAAWLTLAGNK
jgi:hypothetical protein